MDPKDLPRSEIPSPRKPRPRPENIPIMLSRQRDLSETQARGALSAHAYPTVYSLPITSPGASSGNKDYDTHVHSVPYPPSHPPPQLFRVSSTGSDAGSLYTATSSCVDSSVDSSGPNSPTSTAPTSHTSYFHFGFEDQPEELADDEDANQLRNYSLPVTTNKDLRSRPSLSRGPSFDPDKRDPVRSNSASEKPYYTIMPKHLRRAREDGSSPKRSHYTFPFRTATGWATPNSPLPASEPVSRRDSGQLMRSSRRGSKLRESEQLIYDTDKPGPSDEPESLTGTETKDEPMGDSSIDSTSGLIDLGHVDESSSEGMDDGPEGPHTPETSAAADSSDSMSDLDTPRQQPCQNQTEDVCEEVLRKCFNVELQDLPLAVDTLESTKHYLEELANVVYASRNLQFSFPIREVGPNVGSGSSGQYGGNWSNANGDGGGGGGRAYPNQHRKRPNDQPHKNRNGKSPEDQGGEDGDHHEDVGDSPGGNSKRRKTEARDACYPCPFRRRNPLKFNVRDHTTCATMTFADVSAIKRHVKLYHRRQQNDSNCLRCHLTFASNEELKSHLQLPPGQMCEVRPKQDESDPEEGITETVEESLNGRKTSTKIDSWEMLWKALFHDESPFTPEFEPPVELHEVRHVFEKTREPDLNSRMRTECESITQLSPQAQGLVSRQMAQSCWDYVEKVMSDSRRQAERVSRRRRKCPRPNSVSDTPPDEQQNRLMPRPIQPKPVGSKSSSLSSSWEAPHLGSSSSSDHLSGFNVQQPDGASGNTFNGNPYHQLNGQLHTARTSTLPRESQAFTIVLSSSNAVDPIEALKELSFKPEDDVSHIISDGGNSDGL